jgi:fused signal recognition particle receptor
MKLFGNIKSFFLKNEDQAQNINEVQNLLIMNDMSYITASHIAKKVSSNKSTAETLTKTILEIAKNAEVQLQYKTTQMVVFVMGINGSGKTTTIVKLANIMQKQGKKVLVAACDTFRSAASDQLATALSKINCPVQIAQHDKADPSSVAFVASKRTIEESFDVLIIDTAGRLHTNTNLVLELAKIHSVTKKNLPNAHFINIAIMDATIGQNSISQIQKFDSVVPISGVIITKMDTSAKGGALISIIHEMQKKVYFVCNGNGIDAIAKFNAEQFTQDFLND